MCGEPIRNRSMTFFVTATILFVLAVACATSRAVSRGRSFGGAGYGWDDWTLFICCLPMLGLTVTGYMEAHYGLGRDTWDLSLDNIVTCLMVSQYAMLLYTLTDDQHSCSTWATRFTRLSYSEPRSHSCCYIFVSGMTVSDSDEHATLSWHFSWWH